MKSVFNALLRSSSPDQSPSEFFSARAKRVATIAGLDAQVVAAQAEVDSALAGPPSKASAGRLAAARAQLAANQELLARAGADLVAFDRALPANADRIVRQVLDRRAECVAALEAAVGKFLEPIFGTEAAMADVNDEAARRAKVQWVASRSRQVQAEEQRHFPIRSFMDHASAESFVAELPLLEAELAALRARLEAVNEIVAGKRPLNFDLTPYEHERSRPAPVKKVDYAFEPAEPEDHFAARREAAIKEFERKAEVLRTSQGLSPAEIREGGGLRHPDSDPRFRRRMGSGSPA